MAWPTRTGLTTGKKLARALKTILSKYLEWYTNNLTTEQVDLIIALIAACQAFIDNVPQYEPTP
jgi:hypothetical protein